jgi:hypothetical protein
MWEKNVCCLAKLATLIIAFDLGKLHYLFRHLSVLYDSDRIQGFIGRGLKNTDLDFYLRSVVSKE